MFVRVQVPPRAPIAGIAQLVEHDLAKVGVASSSLVSRSSKKSSRPTQSVRDYCSLKILGCPGGGMVDTLDLKSNEQYVRAGSSPAPGTYLV